MQIASGEAVCCSELCYRKSDEASLFRVGMNVLGHEFHYSEVPDPDVSIFHVKRGKVSKNGKDGNYGRFCSRGYVHMYSVQPTCKIVSERRIKPGVMGIRRRTNIFKKTL